MYELVRYRWGGYGGISCGNSKKIGLSGEEEISWY